MAGMPEVLPWGRRTLLLRYSRRGSNVHGSLLKTSVPLPVALGPAHVESHRWCSGRGGHVTSQNVSGDHTGMGQSGTLSSSSP